MSTATQARKLTMAEAVSEGIGQEMARDERVFVMGEDVGKYGGIFSATTGLLDKFGPERIMDTPISETGFMATVEGMVLECLGRLESTHGRLPAQPRLRRHQADFDAQPVGVAAQPHQVQPVAQRAAPLRQHQQHARRPRPRQAVTNRDDVVVRVEVNDRLGNQLIPRQVWRMIHAALFQRQARLA